LAGKPEGKALLGRTRDSWECNIKVDIKERGGKVVDLIHLAEDRKKQEAALYTVMDLQFYEVLESTSLAKEILISQEDLCYLEVVKES
jgi:hypothetical protein